MVFIALSNLSFIIEFLLSKYSSGANLRTINEETRSNLLFYLSRFISILFQWTKFGTNLSNLVRSTCSFSYDDQTISSSHRSNAIHDVRSTLSSDSSSENVHLWSRDYTRKCLSSIFTSQQSTVSGSHGNERKKTFQILLVILFIFLFEKFSQIDFGFSFVSYFFLK